MTRVLRVVAGLDPSSGGPPESTVAACLATERQGAQNTLLFARDDEGTGLAMPLLGRLDAAGVEVHGFAPIPHGGRLARRWGVSPALVRWAWRNLRHDLIHVHGALGFATTATFLIGWLRGVPVVLSPHESLTEYDRAQTPGRLRRLLKRGLRALYSRGASLIVFASEIEAADSRMSTLTADRELVAPHPVAQETAAESPGRSHLRTFVRVGFLGRLHPKKNLDQLIRAMATLPAEVRLTIAGDGPPEERRRLASIVDAAAVADRVEFRGWVDAGSRADFLADVDLLAMPSEYECFGMAGAEALAHGVPVVVSRTTGIAEVVERHGCGIVTDTDPPALAAALAELAEHPRRREDMRARALKAAEMDLSYDAFGERVVRRYRQLAA